MRAVVAFLQNPGRLVWLAAVGCGLTMTGLFTVDFLRILSSLGMAVVFLAAALFKIWGGARRPSRFPVVYYSLMGVWGLNAASGLQTQAGNWGEYSRGLVLQIPFLLLPLAFRWLPGLPGRYLVRLNLWFIGLVSVSALGSLGYYLTHFAAVNEMYLHSQLMPTVPDHIRFSLMVTYAIAACVVLLGRRCLSAGWHQVVGVGLALLVFYQHVLAVRSGLLTLYVLAALAVGWLLVGRRNFRLAGTIAAAMLLVPAASYVVLPTFHNKFENTQNDVGRVTDTASANNYSLVGRVYSYRVAWELVRAHPLLGVGRANLRLAVAEQYRRQFPAIQEQAYILPHNQFLFYLVCYGGVGVLLFTLCFFFPGIRIWPHYAPLLLAQYLIVTLSFLVEYTLELQVGLSYTLLFLLLALNGQEKPVRPEHDWRLR